MGFSSEVENCNIASRSKLFDDEKVVSTSLNDPIVIHPKQERSIPNNFFARRAKCMARNPWYHLIASLFVSVLLSAIGLVFGKFSVAVDNSGWQSRGTLVADRQTQLSLILSNNYVLWSGNDATWSELESNIQLGQDPAEDDDSTRRLEVPFSWNTVSLWKKTYPFDEYDIWPSTFQGSVDFPRRLKDISGFSDCDFYFPVSAYNLWPMWETKGDVSALDSRVIEDICIAEMNTLAVLDSNDLCTRCISGSCYPPLSLVLFARVSVGDTSFSLSCQELAKAWSKIQTEVTFSLQECLPLFSPDNIENGSIPEGCPDMFFPSMVDDTFGKANDFVRYTSSAFQTTADYDALYKVAGQFDRASSSDVVYAAYDTATENLNKILVAASLGRDMTLAMGSAVITIVSMIVHSRSLWITSVGLLQIILSFPLSYFVYYFIGQLKFFPFLNFIGVFVLFALGADDVFVAIDKWKNARIDNRNGSTEDIAAVALPDAAAAMFLTSITTSVAFFSTALSTVAPLKCFAIFCGLLISFAYILCVLLVFPALCIYDKWLQRGNNWFCSIALCVKKDPGDDQFVGEDDGSQQNLIRKILTGYYNVFHKLRWVILVMSVGATIVCTFFALKIEQPLSSDVRLLQSSIMYEQAYSWRLHSLDTVIEKSGGNPGYVIWGTKPADTGDHSNPESWSQLVLDETFDASPVESQRYLLNFCDRFFAEEFAEYTSNAYVCPMNEFNSWLNAQANSSTPVDAYSEFCGGATGIPMSQETFNPCISAWSKVENRYDALCRNGVLKIILISFQQRIRFDSPYKTLNSEWNLIESWLTKERNDAPRGVSKMFHSSFDFLWYDTNGSMLQAAYGSAAISLGFSGLVVLLSSRSFVLTLFSVGTIVFILTSTTAILVASGWSLGFLESVCFAILIGISCDFVLHLGHAYCSLPGSVSRHDRTKYALVHMGPSILAAGFTTIAGAILMLFCMISFFRQFAQILFYTILMSTIGTFAVLVSLMDILGPSEPRYLFDKFYEFLYKNSTNDKTEVVDYYKGEINPEQDEQYERQRADS